MWLSFSNDRPRLTMALCFSMHGGRNHGGNCSNPFSSSSELQAGAAFDSTSMIRISTGSFVETELLSDISDFTGLFSLVATDTFSVHIRRTSLTWFSQLRSGHSRHFHRSHSKFLLRTRTSRTNIYRSHSQTALGRSEIGKKLSKVNAHFVPTIV